MKNKLIITGFVILLVLVGYTLVVNNTQNNNSSENIVQVIDYKALNSSELSLMLENKDFKLIDVHTPEQRHIPETDYLISYNEIDSIVSVLPDKNEKIVLYCRSGSMSKIAAQDLIDRGYTNVFDLTNGLNEWIAQNRVTLPRGSVTSI